MILPRRNIDYPLFLSVFFLVCIGIVSVYSASAALSEAGFKGDAAHYLKAHALYAVIGFAAIAVLVRVPVDVVRKASPYLMLLSFGMLALVLVPGVGVEAGGSTRWLSFAGQRFQPAELAKIALVIYMAHSVDKKKERIQTLKFGFLPYMVILALLVGLMILQPDLGGAATMTVVALCMLFVAGTRLKYIAGAFIISLPVVVYGIVHAEYRVRRILAFIDPWADPEGFGFQIIQSWLSLGNGGGFGLGLGEGRQKVFYLPEAHTDFIFAVIGEEFGFIGVLIVVGLFAVLCSRGIRIALRCHDDFSKNLAFGLTLLLSLQAVVNLMVVMGMVPTKGMALPFLSYGGSSLVTSLMAAGILLSISGNEEPRGSVSGGYAYKVPS